MEANIWSCINNRHSSFILQFFYDLVNMHKAPWVLSTLTGLSVQTSKTEGQTLDFDKFAKGNTTWYGSSGSQPAASSYNFLMPTINLDDIDEKS